jgi:hypothetical protein
MDSSSNEPLLRDSQTSPLLSIDGRREVIDFCHANNLTDDCALFQKAFHLVHERDGEDCFPSVELTRNEIRALRKETTQKWNQPWTLYFTIIVCCIGAIEQGTAQTSMNGANLYFPKELGIGSDSPRDKFLVGLINCGIYFSIAVL